MFISNHNSCFSKMGKRIKVNSRVSTEAWRCDIPKSEETARWSYSIFGKEWRDARIIGTVKEKVGIKWFVVWEIDGEEATFDSENLLIELDTAPKQSLIGASTSISRPDAELSDSNFCEFSDADAAADDATEGEVAESENEDDEARQAEAPEDNPAEGEADDEICMMELIKKKKVVGEGYVEKIHNMTLNENQVCVFLSSVFTESIPDELKDFVVGTSIPWNEKWLCHKREMEITLNEEVKIFHNDTNIGIGTVTEICSGSTGRRVASVSITTVFENNVIISEYNDMERFAVGKVIDWNTDNLEVHTELPLRKVCDPNLWKKTVKVKKRKGHEHSTPKGVIKRRKVLTEYDEVNNCGEKCPRKCKGEFDKKRQIQLRNGY